VAMLKVDLLRAARSSLESSGVRGLWVIMGQDYR
jgi:hypothetical protein